MLRALPGRAREPATAKQRPSCCFTSWNAAGAAFSMPGSFFWIARVLGEDTRDGARHSWAIRLKRLRPFLDRRAKSACS